MVPIILSEGWAKFSDQAKKFHLMLTGNSPDDFHFDGIYKSAEVAAHLGLTDAYEVAGVLGWPRRHCAASAAP